jgi:hypothetical protein
MKARLLWAAALGSLAAVAGIPGLVFVYAISPALVVDMSTHLPRLVTGFHPPERDPEGVTFAWTNARAQIQLPGLDRRADWHLRLRLRGARPDPATLPEVRIGVDGVWVHVERSTNVFQWITVRVPVRPDLRTGAIITIVSDPPFTPGPGDPRTLGVMVDEMQLVPTRLVLPPRRAMVVAAVGAGLMGLLFGLVGIVPLVAAAAAVLLALIQAWIIGHGFGPYALSASRVGWLAFGIAVGTVALVRWIERSRGSPLRQTARFVAGFSASMLYLKLLVLLHPALPVGDAMFHAHRLEWVLAGRYYFTSIAPGLYEFPYAIGLYLFAAPFTVWTEGAQAHIVLLRIIVAGTETAAGVLLYVAAARGWGDRLGGAMAVAVYHVVLIGFDVQAVANLTNAFAQPLATAAIVLVALGATRRRSLSSSAQGMVRNVSKTTAGLTLLMAAAFLSHTSTFGTLFLIVLAIGLVYHLLGDAELRVYARTVLAMLGVATLMAVIVYYGHFGSVYRSQFERISGEVQAELVGARPLDEEFIPPARRSVSGRARLVPRYVKDYYGWPLMLLGLAGVWRLGREWPRHPLSLMLLGWAIALACLLIVGILTPVDLRHYLAGYPALALVAGVGARWSWQAGWRWRVAAVVLLTWAVVTTARHWFGWLR